MFVNIFFFASKYLNTVFVFKESPVVWVLGRRQVDPSFYLRKPKDRVGGFSCAVKTASGLSMAMAGAP